MSNYLEEKITEMAKKIEELEKKLKKLGDELANCVSSILDHVVHVNQVPFKTQGKGVYVFH